MAWRPRLSPLAVFALSAIGWIVALTLLWSQAARWVAWPVGVLSQIVLEEGASGWVRKTQRGAGLLEVETRVEVLVPQSGGRRADLLVEGEWGRYSYSLPIFLGLLLAARGPRRMVRAVAGYLVLLPAQVFSLCAFLLMQIVIAAQGDRTALKVAAWQLDAITYAFQLGSLIVPTLVPILVWLWLDRRFVTTVVLPGWAAARGT